MPKLIYSIPILQSLCPSIRIVLVFCLIDVRVQLLYIISLFLTGYKRVVCAETRKRKSKSSIVNFCICCVRPDEVLLSFKMIEFYFSCLGSAAFFFPEIEGMSTISEIRELSLLLTVFFFLSFHVYQKPCAFFFLMLMCFLTCLFFPMSPFFNVVNDKK